MHIDGKYFLAQSPKYFEAKAILSLNLIRIFDEENNLLEESRISKVTVERFSNSITFTTGSVFSPSDIGFRWDFEDKPSRFFEKISSIKSVIVLSILLLPLLGWFSVTKVIPKFAEQVAESIPEAYVNELSQNALARFDEYTFEPSMISESKQAEIKKLMNRSVKRLSIENEFNLIFFKSDLTGSNAFALPDGTIVITDALVNKLEDTPEALLAILLHEIGHVEKNHGLRLIVESLGVGILFYYIVGDIPGLTELITGSAFNLIQSSFSRSMEIEADEYSLESLEKLGLSSDLFVYAMRSLVDEDDSISDSNILSYLSTHPGIEERIESAKKSE